MTGVDIDLGAIAEALRALRTLREHPDAHSIDVSAMFADDELIDRLAAGAAPEGSEPLVPVLPQWVREILTAAPSLPPTLGLARTRPSPPR